LHAIAKGLYYFIKNEVIEAAYLIIPNIEECLKHILAKNGYSATYVQPNGIEKDKIDINHLVTKCVEHKLINKNTGYILTMLLKPIRDDMAHGKIYGIKYNGSVYVLCYLVLTIILNTQIKYNNIMRSVILKSLANN
jgi:hypothetical protein